MREWLRDHADDGCYLAGACLGGIGVYQLAPVATWFYAAACCVALGALLTMASTRRVS